MESKLIRALMREEDDIPVEVVGVLHFLLDVCFDT